MKIIRVTYVTKQSYVEQNKANISKVMAAMRELANPGINYHVCLGADGKSFTHLAFFRQDEDEKMLLELPEFKQFQLQLKAEGIEIPPKQELLELVGSTIDIFRS